jgi:V8-like Glu-specific endopeptidase
VHQKFGAGVFGDRMTPWANSFEGFTMIRLMIAAIVAFPLSAFADTEPSTTNPSIFQITVPGSDVEVVAKGSFPKPERDDSSLVKNARRFCQQNSNKKCLSFDGRRIGTAFVFIQENMILTSLHTFSLYLPKYWTIEDKNTDIPVPLILIKDGGAVVFGDRVADQAYLTKISDTARQRLLEGTAGIEEEDFVLIRLSRKMGPVLTAAKSQVSVGQAIHVDGFVNHRDVNEWTSSGSVVRKSVMGFKKDYWWHCNLSDAGWNTVQFGTYGNDRGLSGSPVFDAAGEVVGIHTGDCNSNDMSYFIPISEVLKTQ